jgi:UDP-sulfoquinovose synthase
MRVLILGGDGFLGWPTAMALAAQGHEVCAVDNYLRRNIARDTDSEALIPCPNLRERAEIFAAVHGRKLRTEILDCTDFRRLELLVEELHPEAIVHYAEQPSAPYSMMGFPEAQRTLLNNLGTTFNVVWAILQRAPDCHLIKLGTMGEYGTPNIDIEEGWLDVEHHGRRHKFLYPRQAGSLYHTTKVMDTDLLWFYVRTYGLRVTDLMQGPVYGIDTAEAGADPRLVPNFHYDDIFGTVVNRFLVQAVAGVPLTVYGQGGQTRGYLNLKDTLQCVELALRHPVDRGELRILNQFTEQFTVNELAERVRAAARAVGLTADIQHIANPRKELEQHYYNARHSGLLELGLKPHAMTEQVLAEMLRRVAQYKNAIDTRRILPRVKWNA